MYLRDYNTIQILKPWITNYINLLSRWNLQLNFYTIVERFLGFLCPRNNDIKLIFLKQFSDGCWKALWTSVTSSIRISTQMCVSVKSVLISQHQYLKFTWEECLLSF